MYFAGQPGVQLALMLQVLERKFFFQGIDVQGHRALPLESSRKVVAMGHDGTGMGELAIADPREQFVRQPVAQHRINQPVPGIDEKHDRLLASDLLYGGVERLGDAALEYARLLFCVNLLANPGEDINMVDNRVATYEVTAGMDVS